MFPCSIHREIRKKNWLSELFEKESSLTFGICSQKSFSGWRMWHHPDKQGITVYIYFGISLINRPWS